MAGSRERWARSFRVDETRQHRRGFTLYKITSYLYLRTALETITTVSVWKRYSEIQKLQRKMKKMHGELYLKGSCPNFAKWSYFRRFDPEVVDERMKTTQSLLEFIALHSPLFTSSDFVKFFQSSHPDPNIESEETASNIESIRQSLLLPAEPIAPLEYQSSEEDSFSMFDSSASTTDGSSLNKTIMDKRESPSNGHHDVENSTKPTDSTTDEVGPIIMDTSAISIDSVDNVSFISSLSSLKNDDAKMATELVDSAREAQFMINSNSLSQSDDHTISSAQSVTSYFVGKESPARINRQQSRDDVSEPNSSLTRSSSRLDTLSMDFSSFVDLQENYVFEAGYLLSLGARSEAKGEHQKAFDCYKAGIEKMLIGVQGDSNDLRRQFVKDKTTKYLSHAEKLYTTYLNDSNYEVTDLKKDEEIIKQEIKKYPRDLSRPYNELGKYRVLGIIDGRVLLVFSSDAQECQVMKVIEKTCNQIPDEDYFTKGFVDSKLPLLPTNIPYMVKLISYIETPHLLFLVVQYASGGKLFDYINKHAKTQPNTPSRQVNLDNVFVDPISLNSVSRKNSNMSIQPIDIAESLTVNSSKRNIENKAENDQKNEQTDKEESAYDMSVTDIVIKSQRLLLDVDDALSGKFLEKNTDQNGLSMMVTEVEQAFNGIHEKLNRIAIEEKPFPKPEIQKNILPPKTICKWGAELITAIDHLHRHGVICRTLNPNNLLLGDHGQLMLSYIVGCDFQEFLVPLLNMINTSGVFNVYIAPELQQFSFGIEPEKFDEKVCDFWSYGVLMYELITGSPLSEMHPTRINSHTTLTFPDDISKEAESLLNKLLSFNPEERLGSGPSGIDEIKYHPYFNCIDWNAIEDVGN